MGNSASYGGGTYWSTLNNCALRGNFAYDEGGGTLGGMLFNCTLTGNSASNFGGGAYDSEINNCIVYYNVAPKGPNWFMYGKPLTFLTYTCTTPAPATKATLRTSRSL